MTTLYPAEITDEQNFSEGDGRSTFSIMLQKAFRHIVPPARPEHAPRRRDSRIDFRVSAHQTAFRLETDVRDWSATKRCGQRPTHGARPCRNSTPGNESGPSCTPPSKRATDRKHPTRPGSDPLRPSEGQCGPHPLPGTDGRNASAPRRSCAMAQWIFRSTTR